MKLILLYIIAIASYHSVVAENENLREAILKKVNRQPTPAQAKFCSNTKLCASGSQLNKKQEKNGILGWESRNFKSEEACRNACRKAINQKCGEGQHSVVISNTGGDTQKPKYFQRCISASLFKGKINNKTGDTKPNAVGRAICQNVGVCHRSGKKKIAGVQTRDYYSLGYNSLKACNRGCMRAFTRHCRGIIASGRKGTNLKPTIKCLQRNMGGNTRLLEIQDNDDVVEEEYIPEIDESKKLDDDHCVSLKVMDCNYTLLEDLQGSVDYPVPDLPLVDIDEIGK